jgi:hypothetical protein
VNAPLTSDAQAGAQVVINVDDDVSFKLGVLANFQADTVGELGAAALSTSPEALNGRLGVAQGTNTGCLYGRSSALGGHPEQQYRSDAGRDQPFCPGQETNRIRILLRAWSACDPAPCTGYRIHRL